MVALLKLSLIMVMLLAAAPPLLLVRATAGPQGLDAKVEAFLDSHRDKWHDLNVPEADGKILYDLILKGHYTRALEIGTSTGHSGIWIAWALSKTGGKLITIEIDPDRHRQALAKFQAAGLSGYIDARLADAHALVPVLSGPFDFVFCDADKDGYTNYFTAVWPRVEAGGIFVAHNVTERGRSWGTGDFLRYVQGLPDAPTTFPPGSAAGISVTHKKK